MNFSKWQRRALYLFIFSINFEVYDPFNTGFFSIAKVTGLLYTISLLPNISSFFSVYRIKFFIRYIWLFFLVLTLVSIFNINYISTDFFDFTIFQNILIFWFIVNHERKDPGIIEKSFLFFVFGSIAMAIFYLLGIGIDYTGERISIFGDNENAIGLRMCISTILILLSLIQNIFKMNKWRYLLLIPLPLMLSLMANTGSRVAFISLGVAFLLGVILIRAKNISRKIFVFIGAAFIGLFIWNYLMQTEVLVSRLNQTVNEGSLGGREGIWKQIIPLIEDNIFIGVGKTGYTLYTTAIFGKFASPHNVIFEILAYTGIVGLIIFLIFIGNLVWEAWKYYRNTKFILAVILFIPVIGLILSGQILGTKIGYVIFAFAASRVFCRKSTSKR
ncbi:MAG: O-antigen ligase family protein [Ginsengibacter sp.]